MQKLYLSLLEKIGEDPHREGLKDTPKRAENALHYLTSGYHEDLDEVLNNAFFDSDISEIVLVKNIEMYSLCEHHLLPFFGKCHIGYIPNGKIIGLSKVARIVEHYSRRLQVQENLTSLIASCLMDVLQPAGVGVVIEAQHLCMMMRGVAKQNSSMVTSVMLGKMRDDARTRSEFLTLIKD